MPENQLVSVGAAKALGPLLACLESSKVKAGRCKCRSPRIPSFTVTRNSMLKAKKERMKSEVTLEQMKGSQLTTEENI